MTHGRSRRTGPRRRPARATARRCVPGAAALILACAAGGMTPHGLSAQAPATDAFTPPIAGTWEPVRSMGQPPLGRPFIGIGFGTDGFGDDMQVGVSGSLGISRDLANPLYGLLQGTAQAYFGQRGNRLDGGVRAMAGVPAFFVRGGADWNVALNRVDLVASAAFAPIRGGWFRRGGELRVDWVPTRDHSLVVGTTVPVGQPFAGRTRPRRVDVRLPRPPTALRLPPPAADAPTHRAVAEVLHSMQWITSLHNIFWLTGLPSRSRRDPAVHTREVLAGLRAGLAARDSLLEGRNTYEREVAYYHASLDRAFGLALGAEAVGAGAAGRELADRARHTALAEVVLPYNRTVGQYKKPDVLDGLIARARARFVAGLLLDAGLHEYHAHMALQVFDTWMDGFEGLRQHLARLTNDSRMHWLPLGFVLREEEHETQAQIDALVEVALDGGLTGGNATLYINAPQFQSELIRTIHEAQVYHVLWIHDYRGRNDAGKPDAIGFLQTTEGYLRALLERVRAYDETGRLPVFILMLDQNGYELSGSRLWLDLLERPLTHRARLPEGLAEMQSALTSLQDSLRAAVAGSRRLNAEVAAFGPGWTSRVIKVHVNVTNPSDLTFRSRRLLGLPIGGDNLMRDHRKIVIRDVTEADPAAGEVILTGVGVGEKYASATWEDRGVILQGPAALHAKEMAREVLETNGLRGDDVPAPLRPRPFALDYAQRVDALEAMGATARVLQAHNRTGWGAKDATFVQMLLYDLAPGGSVIYVPDSLWANYEWLAQLVSAALRGCLVFIVAPAAEHAPSRGFPQMSVMQELMTRLVVVQEQFGDVIAEAGGELHVGLYTRTAAMDDLPARIREAEAAFAQHDFLRRIFPFTDTAWAVLRSFRDAPATGQELAADARGRPPQMHRKTQLIASSSLLAGVARSEAMPDVLAGLLRAEDESHVREPESGPLPLQQRMEPSARMLELYASLPAATRDASLAYFMVGSLNKDVRSMALDGEAIALVAGAWALQAYLDFVLFSGAVTWVEDPDQVPQLLPRYPYLQRIMGRLLYRVL
jgi:hypothetical protein